MRRLFSRAVAGCLSAVMVAAIAAGVMMAPRAAAADVTLPPFPRLGMWWPENDSQPAADRARYDWIELQNSDTDHIAELRRLNPDILVLAATNARELYYNRNDYNSPLNTQIREASNKWILTQVGSVLTAAVTSAQTVLPVADTTKFRVGDVVVIEDELVAVNAVGTSSLTVQRGVAKPAASHAAGTRLATALESWPGSVICDVSANCPRVDVGHGAETWSDWNVRRGQAAYASGDWDGLVIDCYDANPSWMVRKGLVRSIDPGRTNVAPSSYAQFDSDWNAGMVAYGSALRTALGPDAVIVGNNGVKNDELNGRNFETFPNNSTTLSEWQQVIIGPYATPSWPGSCYLEWLRNPIRPNLSTIETYEYDGDLPAGWKTGFKPTYRKMRFGLTSALMGDGFFSYEIASDGHGTLGLFWFDEYDNAGKGRGYLGQPISAAYQVGTSGVWRRDYTGGIALVNPSASASTVQLEESFQKIKGTQDPAVNDGSVVSAVTIPSKDGIILLRGNGSSITIGASPTRVSLGATFVLSGRLTPGKLGDPCVVEVRKPGSARWSYSSARLAYTAAGDWWYRYLPKLRGTYAFRARFAGDADRLGSLSRVIYVSVR